MIVIILKRSCFIFKINICKNKSFFFILFILKIMMIVKEHYWQCIEEKLLVSMEDGNDLLVIPEHLILVLLETYHGEILAQVGRDKLFEYLRSKFFWNRYVKMLANSFQFLPAFNSKFYSQLVTRDCCSRKIITYQGTQFTSSFFQRLCSEFQIYKVQASSRHL